MAGKLTLEIAVPERLMFHDEVDSVQVPAANGYLGVLPQHAPLISQLGTGVLSYEIAGNTRYMALNGGVMEVLPDRVRVLADTAEWAEEVDIERAQECAKRARDLLQGHDMEIDVERAQQAILRAQARLAARERRQGTSESL